MLYSIAFKKDGSAVAWRNGKIIIPEWLNNAVSVANGDSCGLVLKNDGTVTAWGYYRNGTGSGSVLMPVPEGLKNVVAIACGKCNCLALVGHGAPVIQSRNINQSATWGGAARFVAAASGAYPLSYQWQLNGTNLDSATNSWLVLNSILGNQGGIYSVVVSNSLGTVTNIAGSLGIQPSFVSSQSSVSANDGKFHLMAGGTAGTQFILETSSDLTNWVSAQTNTFSVDGLSLELPAASHHQFFRIKASTNP
jgi:hypothetical protein